MSTTFLRGHLGFYNWFREAWCYCDNGELRDEAYERPCPRCGKLPTKEGYDACLGFVSGMKSACCGHGVEKAYCLKANL